MSLAAFIRDLAHEGRVLVGGELPTETTDETEDVEREIRELDARLRAHAPASAPKLDVAAARWAAERLHLCCVYLKDRATPPEVVEREVLAPPPFELTATTVWSVDLFFRCLVDLRRMASKLPTGDALRRALAGIGRAWPLAATEADYVGVDVDANAGAREVIDADPCLRRVLAERWQKS